MSVRPYMSFMTIKEWRQFIYPLMIFAWIAVIISFLAGFAFRWWVWCP